MSRAKLAAILPALVVTAGAVAATAHGGFEVAVAAGVPVGIAWIYPLITDGLALVAYIATPKLGRAGGIYAWAVVVTAAALSGLAQAAYLASATRLASDAVLAAGVGGWPAIAGLVAAHLAWLRYLASTHQPPHQEQDTTPDVSPAAAPDDQAEPAEVATVEEHIARRHLEAVPDDPGSDVAKARQLLAEGAGRPTVMKELGLKNHEARALIEQPDRVAELLPRYRAKARA